MEVKNQNSEKTHCLNGHPFKGKNLYIAPNGWRVCKKCSAAAQLKYRKSSHGSKVNSDYQKANKAKRSEDAKRRQKEKRLYVSKIKEAPCTDCGIKYPSYVMDLDHVKGKKICDVSTLVDQNVSLKIIINEIKKCEVVCANCHRKRTHKRKN